MRAKFILLLPVTALALQAAEIIDIGSRRELFVDHLLIARMEGVGLRLHRPVPREIVFKFDQPWEGIYSGYETVLKDGDTYRFYYQSIHLRRYTIRPDGFVSVQAAHEGGELLTKPFLFQGNELSLNYETSAAGGLWVEIQKPEGNAIEGFSLEDCAEIIGDRLEHAVRWKGGTNVGALSGKPVRLRVRMKDADLYSIQFGG